MGNIVWLASYPKSGNTWIRAFLANLIANRSDPVPLNDLPRYCEDEARPELFTTVAGKPSIDLDLGEIIALRPRVHALIAANSRGTRFVKSHNYAGQMRGHPLHNPEVSVWLFSRARRQNNGTSAPPVFGDSKENRNR